MAVPTTRTEFKEWCLRSLGKPVIEINVEDSQVDDRIDEALSWFWDYHFEGSQKEYYKYQLQPEDYTNKYITLPDNIIGAVSIFDIFNDTTTSNMFSIRYQISLNDLYTLTSVSMVPYYMTLQHLQLLEELLVGKMPIRYNRYQNRLYIDGDWQRFAGTPYLVIECYSVVDPSVYTGAWNDRWLKRYATALIKRQWGSNLKKFGNMTMPGGVVFNGQQIYDEADAEIKQIEADMIDKYSFPVNQMIG